jgi:hypothetical protein
MLAPIGTFKKRLVVRQKYGKISGGQNECNLLASDRRAPPLTKNVSAAVDRGKSLRDWGATRRLLPFQA